MKHTLRTPVIVAAGALVITGLVVAGHSAVEAASSTPRSGIARYTVKADRQQAVAEVLGMSQSDLETALKTQTMADILKAKNLSQTDFHSKVKAQLQTDLKNQGYSQDQIDKALSHNGKHHAKKSDS